MSEENKENLKKDEEKLKLTNTKKYIIIGTIIASTSLGFVGVKSIYENNLVKSYQDRVYPKTIINQIYVSNMSKQQLKDTIISIDNELKEIYIKVVTKEGEYKTSLSDLGYKSNSNQIEKEVFNYGKNETKDEQLQLIKSNEYKDYDLVIDLDENKLEEFVLKISKNINKYYVDSTIKIVNNKVEVTNHQNGIKLDEKSLINDIKNKLKNIDFKESDIVVDVKYQNIEPKYKKEELSLVDTKISSFKTTHNSSEGRTSNLKNAASKINNTLLMPQEEFSYSQQTGPVTIANGYKNAPVIVNGKLQDGIGGGICQVSSTMYNAQLMTGILPTQRRNHSLAVSYVQKGLDATVATGVVDYKFKNTLDYPIVISSYASSNEVVVEFWSNKNATKGITYKPISYIEGNKATTYLYGYDENENEVYKKNIDTSVYKEPS